VQAVRLLVYFFAVTNLYSSTAWIRIASGNLEVYSDAAPASARRILHRFELARAVFTPRDTLPTRVLALSREADYRALRPADSAAAFYQSGPDADYIVMQATDPEAWRIVIHEYTHLVLSHNSAVLPQ
jgi:hypothetical protein